MSGVEQSLRPALDGLAWLGRAGFLLRGEMVFCWNPPPGLKNPPKADIIFLTRGPVERCSAKDVESVAAPHTIVVGSPALVGRFRLNQLPMAAEEKKTVLGISVEAVSAAGFGQAEADDNEIDIVAEIAGARIYCVGGPIRNQSAFAGLRADIALLPVSEKAMDAAQALELARTICARAAILMDFESAPAQAEKFVRLSCAAGLWSRLPIPENAWETA